MRAFVVAGLSIAMMSAGVADAEARGGRGGFRSFARPSLVAGQQAKLAPKPAPTARGAVFIGIGRPGSSAAAGSKAPLRGEAPPAVAAASMPRVVEADAPRRPWCDDGKVLGGFCVLN